MIPLCLPHTLSMFPTYTHHHLPESHIGWCLHGLTAQSHQQSTSTGVGDMLPGEEGGAALWSVAVGTCGYSSGADEAGEGPGYWRLGFTGLSC